jgi:hypothetical protein
MLGQPREREESRTVLAAVAAQRQPGDHVLVDGRAARYAAEFYGPRLGLGPFQVLEHQRTTRACIQQLIGDRLRSQGRYQRVWLFSSHTSAADLRLYDQHLSRFGAVRYTVAAPRSAATRYDRTDRPTGPPLARHCLRTVNPVTLP